MSKSTTANFYFTGLDKSGLISENTDKTDKFGIAYIILQNDHLHSKVKKLEDEINELKTRNDELENDNESLETSKTSLKGYVNNQAEYNKLSKQLVEIYDEHINNTNKYREELEWDIKIFGTIFILFEVILLLYKLYNFDIFGIFELSLFNLGLWYIATKVYKSYQEIIKIRNIRKNSRVLKIKEGMADASKGIDILNELFDSI